ncbi:universal stress protein [Streptomyces violaceusniger]|uniref:universal stress protein n=1 Tax=Streptomyces violaceusniger TaxID=68280 RepID=UPI003CD0BCC0
MAVDGSPSTDVVLHAVTSLAELTSASVHVLHIKPADLLYGPVAGTIDLEDDTEARDIVDSAVEQLRTAGVAADGQVLAGQKRLRAEAVLQYAHQRGCDLIVLGPSHHAGLGAALHDSVTRHVVARTPVSVLLVHAVQADQEWGPARRAGGVKPGPSVSEGSSPNRSR